MHNKMYETQCELFGAWFGEWERENERLWDNKQIAIDKTHAAYHPHYPSLSFSVSSRSRVIT